MNAPTAALCSPVKHSCTRRRYSGSHRLPPPGVANAMQIRHPFIVRFYESFVEDEYFCLGSPPQRLNPNRRSPDGLQPLLSGIDRSDCPHPPLHALLCLLSNSYSRCESAAVDQSRALGGSALQSLSIAAAVTCVPKSSRRRNGRCAAAAPQRAGAHHSSAASVTGAVWCGRIPAHWRWWLCMRLLHIFGP